MVATLVAVTVSLTVGSGVTSGSGSSAGTSSASGTGLLTRLRRERQDEQAQELLHLYLSAHREQRWEEVTLGAGPSLTELARQGELEPGQIGQLGAALRRERRALKESLLAEPFTRADSARITAHMMQLLDRLEAKRPRR